MLYNALSRKYNEGGVKIGYAHLITHSPFVYNVVDHVVTPTSISVLLALILWAIDRPKKDNTDEK